MGESVKIKTKTPGSKGKLPVSKTQKKVFQKTNSSPANQILNLQRTMGNREVQRLLKSGTIQAKLTIGKPNDKYEQEADRVADKVMSMPEPKGSLVNGHSSLVQRQIGPEEEEKEPIQTKPLAEQITPLVQRQVGPEEEEELLQTKLIQRQGTEEEEEPVQTKLLQRQEAEEEEETVQGKLLQRQEAEEEEEPVQTKLQRQETEEEEETVQTKRIQRQEAEEEEEPVQTKLQRKAEKEEEEPVQTKLLQRQETGEEEEPVQTKLVQRQANPEEEEKVQTELQRQPEDEKEEHIQRQPLEEEEDKIQRQPQEEEEEEPIQAKQGPNQTPAVTSNIESSVNSLKGRGQPLSESTRSYFESRFGTDFSQVRVHTDSKAVEASKSVNAKAFTTGKDVVFGAGQYSPGTSTGKRLLAHELTHVVQQRAGAQYLSSSKLAISESPKVKIQRGFWSWIKKTAKKAWGGIKGIAESTWNAVKRAGSLAVKIAKRLGKEAANLIKKYGGKVVGFLSKWGKRAIGWISKWGTRVIGWIKKWGVRVIQWLIKWGVRVVKLRGQAKENVSINFEELTAYLVDKLEMLKEFKDESEKVIFCMISKGILQECGPLDKKCILESLPWKKCIIEFARRHCPENLETLTEEKKRVYFNSSVNCTISILLYEFATGTGHKNRIFLKSAAITKTLKDGRAVEQAVEDFYAKNKGKNIDELQPTDYKYDFSPTGEVLSLFNIPKSIKEHMAAIKEVAEKGTWSAFFVAGVEFIVLPWDDILYIIMYNTTGKESLMLHALPDVERDPHKLTEFGTTHQIFVIEVPIESKRLNTKAGKKAPVKKKLMGQSKENYLAYQYEKVEYFTSPHLFLAVPMIESLNKTFDKGFDTINRKLKNYSEGDKKALQEKLNQLKEAKKMLVTIEYLMKLFSVIAQEANEGAVIGDLNEPLFGKKPTKATIVGKGIASSVKYADIVHAIFSIITSIYNLIDGADNLEEIIGEVGKMIMAIFSTNIYIGIISTIYQFFEEGRVVDNPPKRPEELPPWLESTLDFVGLE